MYRVLHTTPLLLLRWNSSTKNNDCASFLIYFLGYHSYKPILLHWINDIVLCMTALKFYWFNKEGHDLLCLKDNSFESIESHTDPILKIQNQKNKRNCQIISWFLTIYFTRIVSDLNSQHIILCHSYAIKLQTLLSSHMNHSLTSNFQILNIQWMIRLLKI